MANALPEYITIKELQQILACSKSKAYEIAHSKVLSRMRIKVGRNYRIEKSKFLELIRYGFEF